MSTATHLNPAQPGPISAAFLRNNPPRQPRQVRLSAIDVAILKARDKLPSEVCGMPYVNAQLRSERWNDYQLRLSGKHPEDELPPQTIFPPMEPAATKPQTDGERIEALEKTVTDLRRALAEATESQRRETTALAELVADLVAGLNDGKAVAM